MHAMTVAITLNIKTETRVSNRNPLSVIFLFINGFTKFSEKMAAGANIAELVVLMIADNKDQKNKIWTGKAVCINTIRGRANCVSPISSLG